VRWGVGPVDQVAVTRAGRPRRFGARAAVVLALLAGLFGMHGLTVGHAPMTMDASVAAASPMAGQVPVPVLPGPAGTVGVAGVSVLSGTGSTGPTGLTSMTSMTCVAVLAATVVRSLLVLQLVFAQRRAGRSWPASDHGVTRRVTPRVLVVPRAPSLFELCVLQV